MDASFSTDPALRVANGELTTVREAMRELNRLIEALGKRVRLRSLDRCSDDLDPLAAEDLVEGAAELRVAIVDQEAWGRGSVGERPRELARLLRDPGVAWMLGAARYVDPAAPKLD